MSLQTQTFSHLGLNVFRTSRFEAFCKVGVFEGESRPDNLGAHVLITLLANVGTLKYLKLAASAAASLSPPEH